MGLDYQEVYKLVEGKMEPILQRVEREYQTTEEYKAVTHRRQIQAAYQKAKAAFAENTVWMNVNTTFAITSLAK